MNRIYFIYISEFLLLCYKIEIFIEDIYHSVTVLLLAMPERDENNIICE